MTRTCRRLICPLAAVLCGVVAEGAGAAVVQVDLRSGDAGPHAVTSYFAAPGEPNGVSVRLDASGRGLTTWFSYGQAETLPGPGCRAALAPGEVDCPIPPEAKSFGLSVHLGDLNDRFTGFAQSAPHFYIDVFGGAGPDEIYGATRVHGGPDPDTVVAGGVGDSRVARGTHLSGGPGDDFIRGGEGRDFINPGKGLDDVDAGGGSDHLFAKNGDTDASLNCGPGKDRAELDRYDWTVACETVDRNGRPRARLLYPYFIRKNPATVVVACPPDMPRRCATTVILSTVSGRPLARRRVSIDRGATKTVRLRHRGALDDAKEARVTVLTERASGPPLRYGRTLSFLAESE